MPITFTKATKELSRARVGIVGPAGSGKTFTALTLATGLGGRIAAIDTERGSMAKYAHRFDFDQVLFNTFDPRHYVEAIEAAAEAGYDVFIIDSLSHAWTGKGGALDLVNASAARSKSNNSYNAWRDVTPIHNELVDAMLQSPMHVIATMRTKTDYVIEEVERKGRTIHVPKKVGMAPIQREGMDFEFDIVGDMDDMNTWKITKSRCEALTGAVINRPDHRTAKVILDWLSDGVSPGAGGAAVPPRNQSPSVATPASPAPASWRAKQDDFNLQKEQQQANADRARVDGSDAGPLASGEGPAPEGRSPAQQEREASSDPVPAATPIEAEEADVEKAERESAGSQIEEFCIARNIPPQKAFLFIMKNYRDSFEGVTRLKDFLGLVGGQAEMAVQILDNNFKA